ncbi:hypothetical protein H113_03260 [Trichophyton rubrum MR1459]|uniref:Uncharacterized protein n=1 Tax=Trichophyton rubrum (strain ATCC MYA-4607 / CBS 118892) TaxID=559305 RepID=A0A080WKD6_TRIRC|nr:uncharacterized protein TERG_12342 [Trichophyton rubrum CBS 118892]EZF96564.1 hypothetical protein H113_03260 [Trichophyton rubrum MR1459]KFL62089.1 hypothetical protein TERG_12342 [Trichophyton rubrum CBS 118892]
MTISSTKKRMMMVMSKMPSTQGYSLMGPVKQGWESASCAGAIRWMKDVAMMTPEPKNLATKNTHEGTLDFEGELGSRLAKTGRIAPAEEPTSMMKMATMRRLS